MKAIYFSYFMFMLLFIEIVIKNVNNTESYVDDCGSVLFYLKIYDE